jgi:hypothetical protein
MIYYNLGSGTTAMIFNESASRSTSKSGMTSKHTEREGMLLLHDQGLSISRHGREDSQKSMEAFPTSENSRRAASHTAQVFLNHSPDIPTATFQSFSNTPNNNN